jgi:hypothetical protein
MKIRQKVVRMAKNLGKRCKKEYKFPIFFPIDFSNSDNRTIGSPIYVASRIVEVQ